MRMPFYDLKAAKQTVSVTINSDLYGQSRRLGLNVSHVAEEALAQAVAARRSEQIRAQIRQDLEALDAYIAQHGSFADMVREHYQTTNEGESGS